MAKHGISILKLGTLLVLFTLGAFVGGAVSDIVFTPLVAQEEAPESSCEQDECDDGWFGGSCENNDGHDTGCNMEDTSFWFDGCTTYVCGEPVE